MVSLLDVNTIITSKDGGGLTDIVVTRQATRAPLPSDGPNPVFRLAMNYTLQDLEWEKANGYPLDVGFFQGSYDDLWFFDTAVCFRRPVVRLVIFERV